MSGRAGSFGKSGDGLESGEELLCGLNRLLGCVDGHCAVEVECCECVNAGILRVHRCGRLAPGQHVHRRAISLSADDRMSCLNAARRANYHVRSVPFILCGGFAGIWG